MSEPEQGTPPAQDIPAEWLAEFEAAGRRPLRFESAPESDEDETPQEEAAVAEAWREQREGKSLSTEELKRKLGLA